MGSRAKSYLFDPIHGCLLLFYKVGDSGKEVQLRKEVTEQKKGVFYCPHLFVICEHPRPLGWLRGSKGPRDGELPTGIWVACWVGSGGA